MTILKMNKIESSDPDIYNFYYSISNYLNKEYL